MVKILFILSIVSSCAFAAHAKPQTFEGSCESCQCHVKYDTKDYSAEEIKNGFEIFMGHVYSGMGTTWHLSNSPYKFLPLEKLEADLAREKVRVEDFKKLKLPEALVKYRDQKSDDLDFWLWRAGSFNKYVRTGQLSVFREKYKDWDQQKDCGLVIDYLEKKTTKEKLLPQLRQQCARAVKNADGCLKNEEKYVLDYDKNQNIPEYLYFVWSNCVNHAYTRQYSDDSQPFEKLKVKIETSDCGTED